MDTEKKAGGQVEEALPMDLRGAKAISGEMQITRRTLYRLMGGDCPPPVKKVGGGLCASSVAIRKYMQSQSHPHTLTQSGT